jgi:hypothetical protein
VDNLKLLRFLPCADLDHILILVNLYFLDKAIISGESNLVVLLAHLPSESWNQDREKTDI